MDTKTLINKLGQMARETTGASFAITQLKDAKWQVTFVNTQKIGNVKHHDIDMCLLEAIDRLNHARQVIETETKYTLYNQD